MRIIILNVWGGKLHEPLIDFISRVSKDTDMFCLQEVFSTDSGLEFSNGAKMNLFQDLTKVLHDKKSFFGRKSKGYDYTGFQGHNINFGNAIFVSDKIAVESYEEIFEDVTHPNYDWTKSAPAKAQFIKFSLNERKILLCNYHGIWINGTHKKDTPERLEQSAELKAKVDAFDGDKIICGDFNLLPDTQSMTILEKDMKNLIVENKIKSTRSALYGKDIGYADYALTSPGIMIMDFSVLNENVSDHLPLSLTVE